MAYARAAAGWKVSRWLALGLSGVAGATFAEVRLRLAGNDAGSWGLPLLGVAAFAQLDWR